MERVVQSLKGKEPDLGKEFTDLFELHLDKEGRLLFAELKTDAVDAMYARSGYFCIVTSEEMTAEAAYRLYRSRDVSEKLFSSDKTFLGSKSLRVHSNEAMSAKMFVEFVGLIIRQRFYNLLKNEMMKLPVRKNYMTVPAALRELDKIELVRINNGCYQLDHAVTKTQETILQAFAMTRDDVRLAAARISETLANAQTMAEPEEESEDDELEYDYE